MIEVVFQLVAPLTTSEPSVEYIQFIEGEIRDRESEAIIGRMRSLLVQVGRISDAGEDLFEVMDGHSAEMAEYHSVFFKPKDWDYKESIRREFPDILSPDFLILDRADIDPTYRKRGLGLLLISRAIDVFGENCGLVAMKPFPLQFGGYRDPGWRAPEGVRDPIEEFRVAKQKLCRYWQRAGFRRVDKTEYWALCPGAGRPSLKAIALAADEA